MGINGFGPGSVGRKIAMIAGSVVLLALVILGVSAISKPAQRDPLVTAEITALEMAEGLADDATVALSNEDTATAVKLATQALAADPSNQAAQRVIDTVDGAADEPADETDPPATDVAVAPGIYAAVVKDTTRLLPVKVRDWTRGQELVEGADALVTFEPKGGSADSDKTVRVLITSHDRGSEANAKAFLTKVTKKAFASSGATVKVGVVPGGYTGVDASKQWVVAFARGRYAFEVILTPQPGMSNKDAGKLALAIAAQLPAAR